MSCQIKKDEDFRFFGVVVLGLTVVRLQSGTPTVQSPETELNSKDARNGGSTQQNLFIHKQ
jgi:hypothetical protein